MKRTEAGKTGPIRDSTRHVIVRVNLLRNTSQIVATVVGAHKADETLGAYKRTLTPEQIGRGDSYLVKSRSVLGFTRRVVWS